MEIKEMNIYAKMSAITEEISKVAKNTTVGVGKSAYKAVGEADILNAVKPIERKYNVYSYPSKREITETNVLTTTSTYSGGQGTETTEKKQLFIRIETVYKFVNIDNPDEFIEVTTYGDGVDSQDKACGKAMTYADKYALMKAYKIETGDDPDQKASEELKAFEKKPYTSQTQQTPQKQQQAPQQPQASTMTTEQALNYTFKSGRNQGKRMRDMAKGDVLWFAENTENETIRKAAQLTLEYNEKCKKEENAPAAEQQTMPDVSDEDLPF